MAKKGPLRSTSTPWLIVSVISELVTRLHSGHDVLKKTAPLTPPVYEQITVGSFIIGGIALALSSVQEAVQALEEAAPCLIGIAKRYEADFEEWRVFRDDASHVVDRTLREPMQRRGIYDHDSSVSDPTYGDGSLVLGYNHERDVVVTGAHELSLGTAIAKAGEIYDAASQAVNEQTHLGNIAEPAVRTP